MSWFGGGQGRGGDNSKSDDEAIEKDQVKHPECGYSKSISQQCSFSSKHGFICEQLREIFRVCPGEPPRTILSVSSKEEKLRGQSSPTSSSTSSSSSPTDEMLSKLADEVAALEARLLRSAPAPSPKDNSSTARDGKQKPWSIKDFDKDEGSGNPPVDA